ncbi:hypothetical protein J6590_001887 [Homalodisca vitripennis]|nr:hypothetical protein J6590_001887 [Homalodisca vitripennis]
MCISGGGLTWREIGRQVGYLMFFSRIQSGSPLRIQDIDNSGTLLYKTILRLILDAEWFSVSRESPPSAGGRHVESFSTRYKKPSHQF